MNSPLEPASPASSISSEGFPIDEDLSMLPPNISDNAAFHRHTFTSEGPKSFAKRRLPGGAGAGSSNRDTKSRRREDSAGSRKQWGAEGKEGRRGDELLDTALMESLKKKIGDPFDESIIKGAV
ncbi:hypothetical protein OF83DRAFT_1167931 [Amylostereum chailletii]|nr:hypothetical protein OF83DRAFT_1167931 [Amylostereum chailletii]